MENIIAEKISADHLLYVSLKYTKTCDVISNLLVRWARLMEVSIEEMLKHAVSKKKLASIQSSPLGKIDQIKKIFSKNKEFLNTIDEYMMFRKIKELKCERIGEFRKNVNLRVTYRGEKVNIDLEKLKEYAEMLENFISLTKQFISK